MHAEQSSTPKSKFSATCNAKKQHPTPKSTCNAKRVPKFQRRREAMDALRAQRWFANEPCVRTAVFVAPRHDLASILVASAHTRTLLGAPRAHTRAILAAWTDPDRPTSIDLGALSNPQLPASLDLGASTGSARWPERLDVPRTNHFDRRWIDFAIDFGRFSRAGRATNSTCSTMCQTFVFAGRRGTSEGSHA